MSVTGTKPGPGPDSRTCGKSSGWHGEHWVGQKVYSGFSVRYYRKKKKNGQPSMSSGPCVHRDWPTACSLVQKRLPPALGSPTSARWGFLG